MSFFLRSLLFALSFLVYPCIALADASLDQDEISLAGEVETIESDRTQFDDGFCDLDVLVSARGRFESLDQSNRFCEGFSNFCRVRKFGDRFYESNYRQRIRFRGRRDAYGGRRGNAWP